MTGEFGLPNPKTYKFWNPNFCVPRPIAPSHNADPNRKRDFENLPKIKNCEVHNFLCFLGFCWFFHRKNTYFTLFWLKIRFFHIFKEKNRFSMFFNHFPHYDWHILTSFHKNLEFQKSRFWGSWAQSHQS